MGAACPQMCYTDALEEPARTDQDSERRAAIIKDEKYFEPQFLERHGSTVTTIAFGVDDRGRINPGRKTTKRELLLDWLLMCPGLENLVIGYIGRAFQDESRIFGSLDTSLSNARETLRVLNIFLLRGVTADMGAFLRMGWPALEQLRLVYPFELQGDLMGALNVDGEDAGQQPLLPKLRWLHLQGLEKVTCNDLGGFLMGAGCLSSLEFLLVMDWNVAGCLEARHVQNLQGLMVVMSDGLKLASEELREDLEARLGEAFVFGSMEMDAVELLMESKEDGKSSISEAQQT